jgi:hypothetical protein
VEGGTHISRLLSVKVWEFFMRSVLNKLFSVITRIVLKSGKCEEEPIIQ